MADSGVGFDEPELSLTTQDIEQKLGFGGGRFTDTNAFFTFLVGLIMSTIFFLLLEFVIGDSTSPRMGGADSFMVQFSSKFIDRGLGGYVMAAGIMLLFFWSCTI